MRVGFGFSSEDEAEVGVMDERSKGHCCIAFDRDLRRMGR